MIEDHLPNMPKSEVTLRLSCLKMRNRRGGVNRVDWRLEAVLVSLSVPPPWCVFREIGWVKKLMSSASSTTRARSTLLPKSPTGSG